MPENDTNTTNNDNTVLETQKNEEISQAPIDNSGDSDNNSPESDKNTEKTEKTSVDTDLSNPFDTKEDEESEDGDESKEDKKKEDGETYNVDDYVLEVKDADGNPVEFDYIDEGMLASFKELGKKHNMNKEQMDDFAAMYVKDVLPNLTNYINGKIMEQEVAMLKTMESDMLNDTEIGGAKFKKEVAPVVKGVLDKFAGKEFMDAFNNKNSFIARDKNFIKFLYNIGKHFKEHRFIESENTDNIVKKPDLSKLTAEQRLAHAFENRKKNK